MIELINVTKDYKIGEGFYHALKGVSIKIDQGELVSIMGASGSGKTSMMMILGLIDRPTKGQYLLDNKDTTTLTPNELAYLRNRTIGFIFQNFFLLPRLSAVQNVSLPLLYSKEKNRAYIHKKAVSMLESVGMGHLTHHQPNQLSGGERQRVAIARALVNDPEIILADEPTGALDTKTGQVVLDLIMHRPSGSTVIVITHDPNVANKFPRIIKIKDGLIID